MFNLAGAIRSMFIQGLISLLDAHSGQIVFALCSAVSEQFMDFSVGRIRHQSPDFGIVGTATYKLKRGEEYDVRLIHMDSQAAQPDDDYQARISTAGNSYVIGPDLLLGVFPAPEQATFGV